MGLSMDGNMRFKIDWTSLIVGSKFAVFALFYFVFEGNFAGTSPPGRGGGSFPLEGRFKGGFFPYRFGGLIFGGDYFRNFTVYKDFRQDSGRCNFYMRYSEECL